jgi:microcystin-dependent protein
MSTSIFPLDTTLRESWNTTDAVTPEGLNGPGSGFNTICTNINNVSAAANELNTDLNTNHVGQGGSGYNSIGGAAAIHGVATPNPGGVDGFMGADDKANLASVMLAIIPVGAVMPFATQTVPTGWKECDGSLISRTTYSDLYAAIGTTYGTGSGTFGLPDLRGEFVRGWDHNRGVDTSRTFGSTQADSIVEHIHQFVITCFARNNAGQINKVGDSGDSATTTYTGSTASTGDAETRPKNVAMMYCIKY